MEAEEDFTLLPLTDRLQHKNWKARVSGYEELAKHFSTADPDDPKQFQTYVPFLKKIVTDANAVAQESGLNTVLQFVQNAPQAASTREQVVPSLVEKSLGSSRANTKGRATEILLMYIEVDTPDPLIELVLPGLDAKQPKVVTQTVVVLREAVKQFGLKTVSPRLIVKTLPKLFGHTDKNVRSEAVHLTMEMYRWLGPALTPHLKDLKPVQQKELEDGFARLPQETPVAERLLRSQQDMQAQEEAEGAEAAEEPEEIDAFDLAEAVDIKDKIPKGFYEQLGSTKWKERKEALEGLLAVVQTPRIADGSHNELVGALAKRIGDANIICVQLAAQCIEALAKGLRNDFAKYKSVVVGPMIEKLKERKASVVEVLVSTLNAVFSTVDLSAIMEDIATGAKHKNPQVRAETVKLLSRRLKEIREQPAKTDIKGLIDLLIGATDDGDPNAREAGYEGLGTLMKVTGEKPLAAHLDKLDDIKIGKVKEYRDKAEVKAKPPSRPAPASTTEKPTKPTGRPKPKAKPKLEQPEWDDGFAKKEEPAKKQEAIVDLTPPKTRPPARFAKAAAAAATAAGMSIDDSIVDEASLSRPTTSKSKDPDATPKTATTPTPRKTGISKSPATRKSVMTSRNAMLQAASSSNNDSVYPLLDADLRAKATRAKRDVGSYKWAFEAPREEHVELLKSQAEEHIAQSFIDLAMKFSAPDSNHFAALSTLSDALDISKSGSTFDLPAEEIIARIIACADLLLKYLTLRLKGSNTTIIMRALDCYDILLTVMSEANHEMTEYEANIILPILNSKVGDPKEIMRKRVRVSMQKSEAVCPLARFVSILMESVATSKNARTRAECLEELAVILETDQFNTIDPSTVLGSLGGHIGDKDSSVRQASLGAISQAYKIIGHDVYTQLGKLNERDKSIVMERLKRVTLPTSLAKPAEEPEPSKPAATSQISTARGTARPQATSSIRRPTQRPSVRQESVQESSWDEEDRKPVIMKRAPAQIRTQVKPRNIAQREPPPPLSDPLYDQFPDEDGEDYAMDMIIVQITSGDANESADALKQLDRMLNDNFQSVLLHVNDIVNAITLQTRFAYTSLDDNPPGITRLCKYLVNSIVRLFGNNEITYALERDSVLQLVHELTYRMLEQQDPQSGSSQQLARAVNVAMTKVLFSANKTLVLRLVDVYRCSYHAKPGYNLQPATQQGEIRRRHVEIILKCLWKLAKILPNAIRDEQLNPTELLQDISTFIGHYPADEWKRRVAMKVPHGEMPLRTMRSFLLELVAVLGDSILDHMQLLDEADQSVISPYIYHLLEACKARENMAAAAASASMQTHQHASHTSQNASPPSPRRTPESTQRPVQEEMEQPTIETRASPPQRRNDNGRMSDKEINNRLTDIFVKIGSREWTKQGIYELYQFGKEHPSAESRINAHLALTGTYFQSYIRRALANLEAEDKLAMGTVPEAVSSPQAKVEDTPRHDDAVASAATTINTTGTRTSVEGSRDRLHRLQEKFSNRSSITGDLLSSSRESRRMSGHISPRSSDLDRTQSVAALKERLARIKLSVADANDVK
ncbi:hypothetical protein BZG36_02598 [Bifiguratus adelaidae]|uniref:TOG domain-containing protein n=1 Tax=Bifiguratus adelaidae TaxID=1938954 RepID=A0A261Y2L4_9FUNG|nr:hypothetical protein BZG36_02598 [Bifiguratus adelaidae]